MTLGYGMPSLGNWKASTI